MSWFSGLRNSFSGGSFLPSGSVLSDFNRGLNTVAHYLTNPYSISSNVRNPVINSNPRSFTQPGPLQPRGGGRGGSGGSGQSPLEPGGGDSRPPRKRPRAGPGGTVGTFSRSRAESVSDYRQRLRNRGRHFQMGRPVPRRLRRPVILDRGGGAGRPLGRPYLKGLPFRKDVLLQNGGIVDDAWDFTKENALPIIGGALLGRSRLIGKAYKYVRPFVKYVR